MPDNTLQESDLLRRMWSGDEEAFVTIYRKHQGSVYRFALQMTGKAEKAEDITQEVFLSLMRGRGTYKPERGSLAAFLYGVTRNHLRRLLERERPTDVSLEDVEALTDLNEDVLGDLTRAQQIDALRNALLTLPATYREVVVLCELHELDYADAAAILACPVGTVRSRLHRARAMLVTKLRPSERCSTC
jgi:RNA polymerase sigma-70 factor (ECF subfamily)